MTPAADTVRVTTRARLGHVENDIACIWTSLHRLEAQLGHAPSGGSVLHPMTQTDNVSHDGPDSDSASDSNLSDLTLANPPTHLLRLFDNGYLGSHGNGLNTPPRHHPSSHKPQGSAALIALMPSREDMLTITTHTSSCLSLYMSLFPMNSMTKTGEEMLSQYEQLQHTSAEPFAAAALLLSIAITVQHSPDTTAGLSLKSIRNTPSFVRDVSDTVERIVVSDDILAGSFDGIQTTMLFVRL